MHQRRIEYLFQKYFDKTASDSERTELMQYINVASDKEIESLMEDVFNSHESNENFFLQTEQNEFLQTIFKENQEPVGRNLKWILHRRSIMKYIAIAAV